jgi:hypothetical protein
MKNRLNITMDEVLVEQARRYADRHSTSLSQLVEQYFKSLIRPTQRKNIIQLVEELPKPAVKLDGDPEEAYYGGQKKKYGF